MASSALYEALDLHLEHGDGEEDAHDDPYARRLGAGPACSSGSAGAAAPWAATPAGPAVQPAAAGAGPASPLPPPSAGAATPPHAFDPGMAATPQSGAAAAAGRGPFATAATVGDCLAFLQPALDEAGVVARLPDAAAAAAEPAAALAAALSAAYELLRLLQRSNEQRERQDEALARLRVEARTADRAAARMQGQSESQGQEAAGLKIKLRQLDAWYRSEVDRWAAEREDLVRRAAGMEQRHAQFVHELRRRDAEHERLQGKLRALLRANCEARAAAAEAGEGAAAQRQGQQASASCGPVTRSSRRQQQHHHQQQQGEPQRHPSPGDRGGTSSSGGAGSGRGEGVSSGRSTWGTPRQLTAGGLQGAADGARAAPTPPSGAAAWHEVSAKLAALRVRAQRVAVDGAGGGGGGGAGGASESLVALAQQASTPHERLLAAKLMEASNILNEQEAALTSLLSGGLRDCR
ncbi:hypothetical protein Rsub_07560 [Raphidocelis subcapitata]|uniref:Uncharacterized protein n=1 Tax=Raphidocelis subcapitata TaxID=307507 RepID=A0A2V0P655_9CHLO|nr:hypothetical protein Rsub_07560 [Raphidocelis subcapitata]|eukprot:GBF95059.1 hypothetical protein Rsub_07560 [Raphidocelis subcapitata]